jgi:hypothetical protein
LSTLKCSRGKDLSEEFFVTACHIGSQLNESPQKALDAGSDKRDFIGKEVSERRAK